MRVEALEFKLFRVFVRYGFKDDPDIPAALAMCAGQGLAFELMESSFFLGRETLIPRKGSPLAVWRERLFIVMFRNAHSAAESFRYRPTGSSSSVSRLSFRACLGGAPRTVDAMRL